MSSASAENKQLFNPKEIDEEISKNGIYIKKGDLPEIKSVFKLLKNLSSEEIDKKEKNISYPKYFCEISNKSFKYIGILTNELNRDIYGYSIIDNKDEFIGEFKEETRNGFGIYKFKPSEEEQEIYIGEYINNRKEGKGMYIKIKKTIKEDSNGKLMLINYISGIGNFKNDILEKGIIYIANDGKKNIYFGKLNELGEQDDDEALFIEEGNKIFKGKISRGNMIEGRNIIINDKYEKTKAYYFTKSKNEKNEEFFQFNNNKNEEKDEECINKMKELMEINYENRIQEIFDEINNAFNIFGNYEKAYDVDFQNDIKNKIRNFLDKIIMN